METLKLNYSNQKKLETFIQKNFFENNSSGKIFSKPSPLVIEKDDEIFEEVSQNDMIVKLYNDIIDGSVKLSKVFQNKKEVHLMPQNRYCINKDNLYSLY